MSSMLTVGHGDDCSVIASLVTWHSCAPDVLEDMSVNDLVQLYDPQLWQTMSLPAYFYDERCPLDSA